MSKAMTIEEAIRIAETAENFINPKEREALETLIQHAKEVKTSRNNVIEDWLNDKGSPKIEEQVKCQAQEIRTSQETKDSPKDQREMNTEYLVTYKDGSTEKFDSINQIEDNRANNPIVSIVPVEL